MATGDKPIAASVSSTRLPAATTPEEEAESSLADRLTRIVDSAVEVLGVDGVGLMLLDGGDTLRTAGFTDPPAFALEQVQAEIGEGPGIDASERAETIAVTDLAEAARYAGLWARISRSGVRAVLASPVRVRGHVVGNLNAVRHRAHRWSDTEIRANEAYARVIGVTLDLAVQTVNAGRAQHPEPGLRRDLPEAQDPRAGQGPMTPPRDGKKLHDAD